MIKTLLLLCTFCSPAYSKSAPSIGYEVNDTYESSYGSGGISYNSCSSCYK